MRGMLLAYGQVIEFVSRRLNNNTSDEEIAKIKEALRDFKTYEIIVMWNIDNINFLK